jgi:hypothetical protein
MPTCRRGRDVLPPRRRGGEGINGVPQRINIVAVAVLAIEQHLKPNRKPGD